jgi:hypothetical protein
MEKREEYKAIIIVTEDNLFLTYCLQHILFKWPNLFIEQSFGIEDFSVLITELIKEEFQSCLVIIDHKTKGNELLYFDRFIESIKNELVIDIQLGLDEYYEFQEV